MANTDLNRVLKKELVVRLRMQCESTVSEESPSPTGQNSG